MRGRIRSIVAAAGMVLALTGCTNAATDAAHEPIEIFAAASLDKGFTEMMDAFKQEHPDAQFKPMVTGGSQELVTQINEGATPDVVALASEKSSKPLIEAGTVAEEKFTIFAENTLVIAVAKGNPKGITDVTDLASRTDIKIAICAPEVPCGAATEKLLDLSNVKLEGATQENNVSATLAKAELGEVDAALVYASDVATSTADLEAVVPAKAGEVVNRYPIAAMSDNPDAQKFVEFVQSEKGKQILQKNGLTTP
ncbi:molybdate ABC transporter substrate-binding protein [Gulosibacter bifidus]|uniref:Molybdate ABC transporter substrate-binding protein n=1 Tax=Gulosibacter bifidus TaxID=272239 RepID=A0ABW5RHV4_9MICO|nr:molybdate ABC transporter substrate-binding protein [Gulosibacter bifidus]